VVFWMYVWLCQGEWSDIMRLLPEPLGEETGILFCLWLKGSHGNCGKGGKRTNSGQVADR